MWSYSVVVGVKSSPRDAMRDSRELAREPLSADDKQCRQNRGKNQQLLRRCRTPFPLWPSHLRLWLRNQKFHSIIASGGPFLLMNEYITYHTNQAYAEYVVDFKLK